MNYTSGWFESAQKVIMGVLAEARPELLKFHGNITHELKADRSIVTRLDKELEIKIKDALKKYDGGVGFLGEEYGREGNEKSYWLVDPIDGTEHFTRGLPGARNLLTFIDKNQPQYALAYRFPTDDLFTAIAGRGTTKNGQKVTLSQRPLDRAWLEFSVNMRLSDGYAIYQKLRPKIAGITIHRDFLEILEGALEGIVVYKSAGQVWDYAPRALLIKEAGGKVTNFGKPDYDINDLSLVAVAPSIYEDLVSLLETVKVEA
ncbi:MAG TPA: inositol monophosphatase family protein [Candidatus Saccharimonadales bacterium]|nr:inositol monophosphatase family protein [Candidatus Saccharimonadales bacterium]